MAKNIRTGRVLNAAKGTVATHPVIKQQEETEAVKTAKAITDIRIAGENPLAKKMAVKIRDEAFDEFESIINADEYLKIVGLNMADHIRKSFTLAEISQMPVVNTNKKADENYRGNNPDYTVVKDGKKKGCQSGEWESLHHRIEGQPGRRERGEHTFLPPCHRDRSPIRDGLRGFGAQLQRGWRVGAVSPKHDESLAIAGSRQRFHFLRNRKRNELFAVTIFQNEPAKIILRRAVADLLKAEIDAAVENRSGNGDKQSKLLLGDDDSKAVGNVRDQPDHLRRFALQKFWGPVGSGVMDEPEVFHVMNHLMGGPEGRKEVRKIDEHISRMPGLEGLRIVETALDARGIPA